MRRLRRRCLLQFGKTDASQISCETLGQVFSKKVRYSANEMFRAQRFHIVDMRRKVMFEISNLRDYRNIMWKFEVMVPWTLILHE
ncbi:hypothetical protein CCR94_10745 [Rhodoblastus sphagnicola]|uniref:Uncharacterized protein n=1 Tax=Rhodoblastus sphagnicola TaxID=333368 RepID=A0A2S6N8L2_9HYPH|nr:hypothetical protein CCR94_10745 [Rhodoblastus sphagnicola]